MNTDMDDVLTPFARERGIGLINAAGLAYGPVDRAGPGEVAPGSPAVRDAASKAAAFCRAHGADIAEVALRFCLDHPFVAST